MIEKGNYKYKVLTHLNMGYALAKWNEEAQMWQQITSWYLSKSNFNRFVGSKYGFKI